MPANDVDISLLYQQSSANDAVFNYWENLRQLKHYLHIFIVTGVPELYIPIFTNWVNNCGSSLRVTTGVQWGSAFTSANHMQNRAESFSY